MTPLRPLLTKDQESAGVTFITAQHGIEFFRKLGGFVSSASPPPGSQKAIVVIETLKFDIDSAVLPSH